MTKNQEFIERHAWQGDGGVRKLFIPRKKAINEDARTVEFVVSTAARDRDGDTVDPAGWNLDKYRENPVVLWAHNASMPPIGRATSIGVVGGELRSVAKFATREEYDFADTVFRLYAGGFLNAVSAGFMPTESDLVEDKDTGQISFNFTKQELWEFSAVPVPSNPEALVAARDASIDVEKAEDWIEAHLDDPAFRQNSAARDLLSGAYIRLKGRVHPGIQADLAKKNAKRDAPKDIVKEPNEDVAETVLEVVEAVEKAAVGDAFTTTGDADHQHQFALGEDLTEPAGEPEHVHSINYEDDGMAVIGAAEGHTHDAPEAAFVEMDEDEGEGADDDMAKEASMTDFPETGDNQPVSLSTSNYRRFPAAEAAAIEKNWPEIWSRADGEFDGSADAIRQREADAADLIYGDGDAAVVACLKRRLVHSKGLDHMRATLARMKEDVHATREKAAGLDPETIRKQAAQAVNIAARKAIEAATPIAIKQAIAHARGRLD